MNNNDITKKDIYIAYKKAKFEIFNDKNTFKNIELLKFEENLVTNINSLYEKLENNFEDIEIGGFFEFPKSLEDKEEDKEKVHFHSNSLNHNKLNQKSILNFRKIIDATIEFHIISALWIMKVGQYIDQKFDSNIYGARLYRVKPINIDECSSDDLIEQPFNIDSPRIFESYIHKYTSWKNNGFKKVRELHKSSSAIVITMDITSFYHSIELEKFKQEEFYKNFNLIDIFINDDMKKFHESFIDKLIEWNKFIKSDKGIPIGLSASPILANATMNEFDEKVKTNLNPSYYGRYVDDIILVFPDSGNLNNGQSILDYLVDKKIIEKKGKDYSYNGLIFKKSKQKIFYFDKNADLSMIDAMESEINSISSEWRFLPDIANRDSKLLKKIIDFKGDAKEFKDSFRKVDAVTIKRLGLAMVISQAHSLNRYIGAKNWYSQRKEIYEFIQNTLFIPTNFISNYSFILRIFKLMMHSKDIKIAYCFIQKIFKLIDELNEIDKKTVIGDCDYENFRKYNSLALKEIFIETFDFLKSDKKDFKYIEKIINFLFYEKNKKEIFDKFLENVSKSNKLEGFKLINKNLFLRDLSFDSFAKFIVKEKLVGENIKTQKLLENINIDDIKNIFYESDEEKLKLLEEIESIINIKNTALIFPTRLFSGLDISIILSKKDKVTKKEEYIKIVKLLRGEVN